MIILTGACGFIGSHFKKALQDKKLLEVEQDDCFYFLNSFDDWNKVELILHQGAISSTVETDLNKLHKYNVNFSIRLFEKAIEHKIPVKYASSASVYGMCKDKLNPLNYYAISKLQIDYWVNDNIEKFSNIQGFRYFNVYGSGEDHKKDQASPIHKFTKQVKESGKIKLFAGSESFYRDFVCVDDVVNCVLNNKKINGIYDLGSSSPISFYDVAKIVVDKYGGEIETIPFPTHLVGKYQKLTCAKRGWDGYEFMDVKKYVDENNIC